MADDTPSPSPTFYQSAGLFIGAAGLALSIYGMWRSSQAPPAGVAPAAAAPETPKRILNPGDHILLLGDSIGEGIQMPLNQRIDDYGAKLTSLVKRGASAAYWADKITDADGAYEVVITTLGTNDIAGSYEQEGPALDRLLGHLESHGAPVYWVIPPAFRIGNFTERQAGWANMLTERGVRILDLQGPQPSTASDPMRVHLTPDGYKTLAAQIVDALTRS